MKDSIMSEKTILIVDDEPDILHVLASGLSVLGFSVISENNGSDAIITAVEKQPDLIILDVIMPGMDGGEVSRKLKELPETTDIPVIFLTGMFPKRDQSQDFRMIDDNIMLDKPYEMGELFLAIKKMLRENSIAN
jgi:CheY-like chemotaxis protein